MKKIFLLFIFLLIAGCNAEATSNQAETNNLDLPETVPTLRATSTPELSNQYVAQIGFVAHGEAGMDIFIVNPDGENLRRLVSHLANEVEIAWHPDGDQVAFISNRSGSSEIYMLQMDDFTLVQITDNQINEIDIVWSTNGESLFFVSDTEQGSVLFRIDLISLFIEEITDSYYLMRDPIIDLNNEFIYYTSITESGSEIYRMTVNGSRPQRLTNNQVEDGSPILSPDGEQILYLSGELNNQQIFLMDTLGRNNIQITNELGSIANIAWTLDGSGFYFSRCILDAGCSIYHFDIDNRDLENIFQWDGEIRDLAVFSDPVLSEGNAYGEASISLEQCFEEESGHSLICQSVNISNMDGVEYWREIWHAPNEQVFIMSGIGAESIEGENPFSPFSRPEGLAEGVWEVQLIINDQFAQSAAIEVVEDTVLLDN